MPRRKLLPAGRPSFRLDFHYWQRRLRSTSGSIAELESEFGLSLAQRQREKQTLPERSRAHIKQWPGNKSAPRELKFVALEARASAGKLVAASKSNSKSNQKTCSRLRLLCAQFHGRPIKRRGGPADDWQHCNLRPPESLATDNKSAPPARSQVSSSSAPLFADILRARTAHTRSRHRLELLELYRTCASRRSLARNARGQTGAFLCGAGCAQNVAARQVRLECVCANAISRVAHLDHGNYSRDYDEQQTRASGALSRPRRVQTRRETHSLVNYGARSLSARERDSDLIAHSDRVRGSRRRAARQDEQDLIDLCAMAMRPVIDGLQRGH